MRGAPDVPLGSHPPQNCLLLTLSPQSCCPQPCPGRRLESRGKPGHGGGETVQRGPLPSPQAPSERGEDLGLGAQAPPLAVLQP